MTLNWGKFGDQYIKRHKHKITIRQDRLLLEVRIDEVDDLINKLSILKEDYQKEIG